MHSSWPLPSLHKPAQPCRSLARVLIQHLCLWLFRSCHNVPRTCNCKRLQLHTVDQGYHTIHYSWHHKSAYTHFHFCGLEHCCASPTDVWSSVTIPLVIAHPTLQPQLFRFLQTLARFKFPAKQGITCWVCSRSHLLAKGWRSQQSKSKSLGTRG